MSAVFSYSGQVKTGFDAPAFGRRGPHPRKFWGFRLVGVSEQGPKSGGQLPLPSPLLQLLAGITHQREQPNLRGRFWDQQPCLPAAADQFPRHTKQPVTPPFQVSALVFTIAVLLLLAIGTAILRRRIQCFRILWIIGHSEQTIGKNHRNAQLIELAIPLICLIPATALFPHWNLSFLVGAVLTVMIGSLIYSAWCGTVLHRTLHRATD